MARSPLAHSGQFGLLGCAAVLVLLVSGCGTNATASISEASHSEVETSNQVEPPSIVLRGVTTDRGALGVSGSSLPPNIFVDITLCLRRIATMPIVDTDYGCDNSFSQRVQVRTDSSGAFKRSMRLSRYMGISPRDGVRREIDCGRTRCSLAAISGGDVLTATPLVYDDETRPAPRLHYAKDRSRRGQRRVRIHGSGFNARSTVELSHCLADASRRVVRSLTCVSLPVGLRIRADVNGRFTRLAQIPVQLRGSSGKVVRCDRTPGRCALSEYYPTYVENRMTIAVIPRRVLTSS